MTQLMLWTVPSLGPCHLSSVFHNRYHPTIIIRFTQSGVAERSAGQEGVTRQRAESISKMPHKHPHNQTPNCQPQDNNDTMTSAHPALAATRIRGTTHNKYGTWRTFLASTRSWIAAMMMERYMPSRIPGNIPWHPLQHGMRPYPGTRCYNMIVPLSNYWKCTTT